MSQRNDSSQTQPWRAWIAAALLTSLVGCGGGGGGGGGGDDTETPGTGNPSAAENQWDTMQWDEGIWQ